MPFALYFSFPTSFLGDKRASATSLLGNLLGCYMCIGSYTEYSSVNAASLPVGLLSQTCQVIKWGANSLFILITLYAYRNIWEYEHFLIFLNTW